jgi:hypothetical protein
MNTKEYAEDLKLSIDANRYATLIASLGNQLNERMDRFAKAKFIEMSLQSYTNGRLKYVNDEGRDHIDTSNGLDLEFKYMANGLFTKTGKPKATIKVKLKNSLGKNKGTTIENPADFYMLGQQDSIAIISGEDIKKYLVAVPDGIEAHIPFDAVNFVFEKIGMNRLVDVNFKEKQTTWMWSIIESI